MGKSLVAYEDSELVVVTSGVLYRSTTESTYVSNHSHHLANRFRSGGLEAAAATPGHFSCLIVEKGIDRAHAFGDDRGGKRIFFSEDGAVLATKLYSVSQSLSRITPDIDHRDFTLVFGYAPHERTVYREVSRLDAGWTLTVDTHGLGRNSRTRPRQVTRSPGKNEATVIGEMYDRFHDAVNSILDGYDRVAVFLGGFDSALVASLARRSGRQVHAYTFKYENEEFNQKNIDNVKSALDIEHTWVPISAKTISEGFHDYRKFYDRPTNWPNYLIQTRALAEFAERDGAEAVLTGDGCDEIFLGYPGIYRGSKFFADDKIAGPLEVALAHGIFKHKGAEQALGHLYRLGMRVIRNRAEPLRTRLYLMFRIMDESTIAHIFGWPEKDIENRVRAVINEIEPTVPDVDPTLLAYEGRDHIVPNRLKINGVMDGIGLPVYTPYMHPLVRDYVRELPEELLRPGGEAKRTTLGKDILLKMADQKGLLPHEVIYQPKHAAVDGPLDYWYATDLRDQLTELIRRIAPVKDPKFLQSILDEKWVEKVYRRRFSVDSITSHAASMLATYGSYFDN